MDREKPSNVNPSCSVWWRQDMTWGREGFIGGHEQPWFTPYEQPGPSQEEWDLIYPGYCLPAPPPRISSAFSSWRGLSLYITVPWGSKMPLCSSLVLPEVLALRLWAWSLRTTMQIRSKVCKKIFSYFHALQASPSAKEERIFERSKNSWILGLDATWCRSKALA